jgi:hypothetical protein
MISRLLAAFQNSLNSLETFHALLLDVLKVRRRYPDFLSQIRNQYDESVIQVAYFYKKAMEALRKRGGRYRSNPQHRSIETLELMFMKLRDATKKMEAEARAFYIGKQKAEAKASARRARALGTLTKDAADNLVAELRSRGAWNEAIVRELGLLEWVTKR